MDNRGLVYRMIDFFREIGLEVTIGAVEDNDTVAGVRICYGTLLVDPERVTHPGDLLHEAGHIAPFPQHVRRTLDGRLEKNDQNFAGEIMAQAWSYAACLHLGIDPKVVFHDDAYYGRSDYLVETFRNTAAAPGTPLMEAYGLTYLGEQAAAAGVPPYPHMVRWVCNQ